ncbi:acetolactate synthase large subunit [Henriciella marina]|uniref:Acetolactate synthase large subunit n=1 Tax=Henriciella marina TaxID=453851 RepID=A0ABT4LY24_9PROT|nr:acetolactate synthase large subunit [Henriciella marina]MCZ4299278.1 acetolactate synthase large subunit [Henriciella marina]
MAEQKLTGADALVSTLAENGLDACFANPGTSEMHLVTALDRETRIKSVLCLFEGVATGAADGYARIAGKPAMTLLHLGAGYLNGGANIHNAKRAHTPMINVIGDHAVDHRKYDAPLNSDIMGLAGPNSVWIKSADNVKATGKLAAEAFAASFGPVSGPVSLILPADSAWEEGGETGGKAQLPQMRQTSAELIAKAKEAIGEAKAPVILINGTALTEQGLAAAARLKAAGVRVITDTFYWKMRRGAGVFAPDRMQYFAEGAMSDLEGADLMLVAGTSLPAAFFAYPGKPSLLVPGGCETLDLGGADTDSAKTLLALADAMGAADIADPMPLRKPDAPKGELNAAAVGASVARHMPENAIVSDDGVSNSLPVFLSTMTAEPHDWMMLTGGAIGQGLPLALGAAVAAPDRKVIALTGDGAGMYTNQALWSMVREGADVTTIVFVNHTYRILNIELHRTGAGNPGPTAKDMLAIGEPDIDWVSLAESMGVEATAVTTAEDFDEAFEKAMKSSGPKLIAAIVPG